MVNNTRLSLEYMGIVEVDSEEEEEEMELSDLGRTAAGRQGIAPKGECVCICGWQVTEYAIPACPFSFSPPACR
jgi:hypothetical protein